MIGVTWQLADTKAIEYDKRIAAGYTPLNLDHGLRDQILSLAIEDSPVSVDSVDDPAPFPTKTLNRASTANEHDKTLLRLFITYNVLARLGFSEARITQCLLTGLEDGEGWEEALEWMWLHLSEDECLQRGVYAPREGMSAYIVSGTIADTQRSCNMTNRSALPYSTHWLLSLRICRLSQLQRTSCHQSRRKHRQQPRRYRCSNQQPNQTTTPILLLQTTSTPRQMRTAENGRA